MCQNVEPLSLITDHAISLIIYLQWIIYQAFILTFQIRIVVDDLHLPWFSGFRIAGDFN